MLTVKHITLSGEEFIYPTPRINFVPGTAKGQGVSSTGPMPTPHDSLWIYEQDNPAIELTGGTIFVMNEFGKTVSRYDLGASEVGFEVNPIHSAYALKRNAQSLQAA